MESKGGILFLIVILLFSSLILADNETMYVKPIIAGAIQAGATINYNVTWAENIDCTNISLSRNFSVTMNAFGIGVISQNISTLRGYPNYKCEYRGTGFTFRKTFAAPTAIFSKLIISRYINSSEGFISDNGTLRVNNVTANFINTTTLYVVGTINTTDINISNRGNARFLNVSANLSVGNGAGNAIILGGSPMIYSTGDNNVRLADITNTAGIDINLSTTTTIINTVSDGGTIFFQSGLFSSAALNAVAINPLFNGGSSNFRALRIAFGQNGSNTQTISGISLFARKDIDSTTLSNMTFIDITSPIINGTVSNIYGVVIKDLGIAGVSTEQIPINILSQTGTATTARAININGTGISNAIRLGSPNIYSNGQEDIRFTDSTNGGGLGFTVTGAGNQQIFTTDTGTNSIVLQQQTFTSAANHNAVSVFPTWSSNNNIYNGFYVVATQNGDNSASLNAIRVALVKATGATTLAASANIMHDSPAVTGTINYHYGDYISNQGNANIINSYGFYVAPQSGSSFKTRAVGLEGIGINNALQLGNSSNIYASANNTIVFSDSYNLGGIEFNLTSNSSNRIRSFSGNLIIDVPSNNLTSFSIGNVTVMNISATTIQANKSFLTPYFEVNSTDINILPIGYAASSASQKLQFIALDAGSIRRTMALEHSIMGGISQLILYNNTGGTIFNIQDAQASFNAPITFTGSTASNSAFAQLGRSSSAIFLNAPAGSVINLTVGGVSIEIISADGVQLNGNFNFTGALVGKSTGNFTSTLTALNYNSSLASYADFGFFRGHSGNFTYTNISSTETVRLVNATQGYVTDGTLNSGTFTPIITNITGAGGLQAFEGQYIRLGNTFTYSGKIDASGSSGGIMSQINVSLPILTNIGSNEDCAGSASSMTSSMTTSWQIYGNESNNAVTLQSMTASQNNQSVYYQYTCQII